MFARSASRFAALASNAARTGSVTRRCVQYRNVCVTAAASCSPADGVSVSKPSKLVPGREPLLFTPGPLTTSAPTKQAMLVDLGSRDSAFVQVVRDVRNGLLDMAGVSQGAGYECIIMQGSGTYGVESVLSSVVPRDGKLLIVNNGAYGVRMGAMARVYGIDYVEVVKTEREAVTAAEVRAALEANPDVTTVAVVHHETTSGALNPVDEIGHVISDVNPDITYIVDSMSAFGAYPVDMKAWNVHYMVSSSNKCIEGVPGFSYILADRERLEASEGCARTLSLNILAQWQGLENNGQFRFTPPTHALLAFKAAMDEHKAEGGIPGRYARYKHNFEILKAGMADMGFHLFLDDAIQGVIISTFLHPDDKNFDFPRLYTRLAERGLVIYPGKLTAADCFRIGSIGRLFEHDMVTLLSAFKEELLAMGVKLPVTQIEA